MAHSWQRASVFLAALGLCASAHAGGFVQPELGAVATGQGGAIAAGVDDATALYFNPANLTKIKGLSVFLAGSLTRLSVTFDRDGIDPRTGEEFPAVEHKCENVSLCNDAGGLIPALFIGYGQGDEWGVGIGAFAPPGIKGVEFPEDGPQRFQLIRQENQLLWISAGGAYRVGPVRFGATFMMGNLSTIFRTMVDANPNLLFLPGPGYLGDTPGSNPPYDSQYDVPFEISASGWAPTGRIGVTYEPIPGLAFSITTQATTQFVLQGKLDVALEGPFEDFAISDDAVKDVTIDFPWFVRLGAQYTYAPMGEEMFSVMLDANYESWSQYEELRVTIPGGLVTPGSDPADADPIGDLAIIKQWQDTFSVRAGGRYKIFPWWTARIGGFYETETVPEKFAGLDNFAYERGGVGGGFTFEIPIDAHKVNVHLSYQQVFHATREVNNHEGRAIIATHQCSGPDYTGPACGTQGQPPGAPIGNGTYESGIGMFGFALEYKWDPFYSEAPVAAIDNRGMGGDPVDPEPVKPATVQCQLPDGTATLDFKAGPNSAAHALKVNKVGLEQYEQISYSPGAQWPLGKYKATLGNKSVTLDLTSDAGAGKYTGTYTEGGQSVGVTCDTL